MTDQATSPSDVASCVPFYHYSTLDYYVRIECSTDSHIANFTVPASTPSSIAAAIRTVGVIRYDDKYCGFPAAGPPNDAPCGLNRPPVAEGVCATVEPGMDIRMVCRAAPTISTLTIWSNKAGTCAGDLPQGVANVTLSQANRLSECVTLYEVLEGYENRSPLAIGSVQVNCSSIAEPTTVVSSSSTGQSSSSTGDICPDPTCTASTTAVHLTTIFALAWLAKWLQ
jgi:hypothetical protein